MSFLVALLTLGSVGETGSFIFACVLYKHKTDSRSSDTNNKRNQAKNGCLSWLWNFDLMKLKMSTARKLSGAESHEKIKRNLEFMGMLGI